MKPQEISSQEYRKMKLPKAKYHNKKVEYRGIIFDSIGEKDRYIELRILEAAGEIKDLELQKSFKILEEEQKTKILPKQRAVYYVADFYYNEKTKTEDLPEDQREFHERFTGLKHVYIPVIEDFKGFKTKEYKLKKKIMRSKGFIVRES